MNTPLTQENLVETFQSAGFDTVEKLQGFLDIATAQVRRNSALLGIAGLAVKAQENAAVIEARRLELQAMVNNETAIIEAAVAAAAQG